MYGFEIRSLQEFFAATYLAQTAENTIQRFDRLKAIARSAHWRNVALFFAGRIVRVFSGESANILELVCRAIDRETSERYIKHGAWLALDIAADGAFAGHRDLQYSTIEYALTVIETGVANSDQSKLLAALQRLSREDRQDILKPLLEQKLVSLPLSCLRVALNIYGQLIGTDLNFIQGLNNMLDVGSADFVESALTLGLQHRAEPRWVADKLDFHWKQWSMDNTIGFSFISIFLESPEYIHQILSAWKLSNEQLDQIINSLIKTGFYHPYHRGESGLDFDTNVKTFKDQLIMAFRCIALLSIGSGFYVPTNRRIKFNGGEIQFFSLEQALKQKRIIISRLGITQKEIERILCKSNLSQYLRLLLWNIYWVSYETPDEETTIRFIKEYTQLRKLSSISSEFGIASLRRISPLLNHIITHNIKGKRGGATLLRKYLTIDEEKAINSEVFATIRHYIEDKPAEEVVDFMMNLASGTLSFPNLSTISETYQITDVELVKIYLSTYLALEKKPTILPAKLVQFLRILEESELSDSNIILSLLGNVNWSSSQKVLQYGIKLLDKLANQPINLFASKPAQCINLFISLMSIANEPKKLAISFFRGFGVAPMAGNWPNIFYLRTFSLLPNKHLKSLASFVDHQDKKIQLGAIAFWGAYADTILKLPIMNPTNLPRTWNKLLSFRLAWQTPWSLVQSPNHEERIRGIQMLFVSNFPIKDIRLQLEVEEYLAQAEMNEATIWAQSIENSPIFNDKKDSWIDLLVSIVSKPRSYKSNILAAAMGRLIEMTNVDNVDLEDSTLGLSVTKL